MLSDENCSFLLNDIMIPNDNIWNLELVCGNVPKFNITLCNSWSCKFKTDSQPRDKVVGSVSNRMYYFIVSLDIISLNCHSSNLAQIITRNLCHLQYVGETVQKLNQIFYEHKTGSNHRENHGNCRLLSDHFNVGTCKGDRFKI